MNAFAAVRIWSRFVERLGAPKRNHGHRTKIAHARKRRWRLLQVESSIACNLRCVMCPWKQTSKQAANRGVMSQGIWEALRPYLPDVTSVDFTGGGEPLLQPRLTEWIAEAKAAGCETGFLSNGLLLQEGRLKEILKAGVDWICISMDGADKQLYESIRLGSSFERVCENVARIAAVRAGKVPKTMINFVLMNLNFHQVEGIVRLAHRLGVDQVNYKQCDVIRGRDGKGFGLFGAKETREIRRLKKALAKARRLAKKLNIQTTAFAFTPEELPVCEQDPRNSLFVRYDGAVAPCINLAIGGPTTFLGREVVMPTVHYGHLPDVDLTGLWRTDTCRFYRQRFQQRVEAQEEAMVSSLLERSGGSRERTMQAAREAMPQPPQGCRVCHYLYDI